jgi:hypothetical protein
MEQQQNNSELTDEEQSLLIELLRQNSQERTYVLPITQSLIEAILGGDVEIADVARRIAMDEPQEEQSMLGHRYFYDDDDTDEDVPTPKRLRYSTSGIAYFFKLSSGEEFYYTEEDIKPTLLNEYSEPNPIVRIIIGNLPNGIKNRLNYLAKFRFDEIEEEDTDGEEDSQGNMTVKPRQFDNVCIQVFSAYMREMKLRNAFRRVWALWKIYKLNKRYQDNVDPITLSEPVNKVEIYESNRKYVFDATSLATWIESKLHYQEYGFAVPMNPCNPWTNMEFTYNQMVSIYYQLKHYGELRWGLITLRQHNFNKEQWHLYHRSALTMKAIKTNLWGLENGDAREMLEDFIFAMMDELRMNATSQIIHIYRQAIRRAPHHWYLEKWKALTFKNLEGEHFGYNRRRTILNSASTLFRKQELFFKELMQAGIN